MSEIRALADAIREGIDSRVEVASLAATTKAHMEEDRREFHRIADSFTAVNMKLAIIDAKMQRAAGAVAAVAVLSNIVVAVVVKFL